MTHLLKLYAFYLSHPKELILHFAALLACCWIVGAVIFAVWAARIVGQEETERRKFDRILQASTPPRAAGINPRRVS